VAGDGHEGQQLLSPGAVEAMTRDTLGVKTAPVPGIPS